MTRNDKLSLALGRTRRLAVLIAGGTVAAAVGVVGGAGVSIAPALAALGTPTTYTNATQATASYYDYVVPAGTTSVQVALQGKSGEDVTPTGPRPGKGAVVTATVAVTPGETLRVNFRGNGGNAGSNSPSGGYGGQSVRLTRASDSTVLLEAGGGGGPGGAGVGGGWVSDPTKAGGDGGDAGAVAADGGAPSVTGGSADLFGKGATLLAGGAGGTGGACSGTAGADGLGGSSCSSVNGGGGGGGGWFGGGGGAANNFAGGGGGGGAGSSYPDPSNPPTGVSKVSITTASALGDASATISPIVPLCASSMVLVFDTTLEPANNTVTLPLRSLTGTVDVDWGGAGTASPVGTGAATDQVQHYAASGDKAFTYTADGTYTVEVCGTVTAFGKSGSSGTTNNITKLTTVSSFGNVGLLDLNLAFSGATNLTSVPASLPSSVAILGYTFLGATKVNDPNISGWDTTNVTFLGGTFQNAAAFNQSLNSWTTSSVTNMVNLFNGATAFNGNISSWNTANVTNMSYMFQSATAFNQAIGSWSTGNVTTMLYMFKGAAAFNQPIGTWDVSKVTTFSSMFDGASSFDQDLSGWKTTAVTGNGLTLMFKNAATFNNGGQPMLYNSSTGAWDVHNVTSLNSIFYGATLFNQPVGNWNTAKVTDLDRVFQLAAAFNQSLAGWDVSKVTTMQFSFYGASAFNGDITTWKTNSLTTLQYTFRGTAAFNQPIDTNAAAGTWDVSKVTTLEGTFLFATAFDQPLSHWNTAAVTSIYQTFAYASRFNQGISTWDVSHATVLGNLFFHASRFDQDLSAWNPKLATSLQQFLRYSGLSTDNYDKLLIGWAAKAGTLPLSASAYFGAQDKSYSCTATAARGVLTSAPYNWSISDLGPIAVGSPSITSITPSFTSLSVAYTAPSCPGGTDPTVDNYEYSTDGGTTWNAVSPSSATSPLVISGLASSTSYDVRIRAVSSATPGAASALKVGTTLEAFEVTSVDPAAGSPAGGTGITITGSGFKTGATVTVGGVACTSVTVLSSKSITCTTGAHASAVVDIVVTNTDTNTATGSNLYSYLPVLYVVPDDPTDVTYGDSAPSYTLKYYTDAAHTNEVTPTLTTVPTCGSSYTSSTSVSASPVTVSCGGGTNSGSAGSDAAYSLDYSATVTFAILKKTLYVVPSTPSNATYGGSAPTYSFKYYTDSGKTNEVTPTVATAPTCGSPFTPSTSVSGSPLTVSCGGNTSGTAGTDTNYSFDYSNSSSLTIVKASSTTTVTCPPSAIYTGSAVELCTASVTGAGGLSQSLTVTYGSNINRGTSTASASASFAGDTDHVSSNDSKTFSIEGPGFSAPAPSIPNTLVGQTSAQQTITVTNTGNASLVFGAGAVTLTGTSPSEYSIVTDNCSGQSLAATATCTVIITFSPSASGSRPASLSLASNVVGTPSTVALNGSATPPGPAVTSISPNLGPTTGGQRVTITGYGFVAGSTVKIGGTTCSNVVVVDQTTITCTTGSRSAGLTSVAVSISRYVTITGSNLYTYVCPPSVTSVSPSRGGITGGTSVTINGSGFVSGSTVTIGGVACSSVVFVSAYKLTCTTGARASGVVNAVVTLPNLVSGTGKSLFTYLGPPTVTGIKYAYGTVLGGTYVHIYGSGFVSALTITMGGVACAKPVIQSYGNEVDCYTGAHAAGLVDIVVTTPFGTATLTGGYRYK